MSEVKRITETDWRPTDPGVIAFLQKLESTLECLGKPTDTRLSFEEEFALSRDLICDAALFCKLQVGAVFASELDAMFTHYLRIMGDDSGCEEKYDNAVTQFNRVYETAFPVEFAAHAESSARLAEERRLDFDLSDLPEESADARWAFRLSHNFVNLDYELIDPYRLRTIADLAYKFVNTHEPPTAIDAWLDVVWELQSCENIYKAWGAMMLITCAGMAEEDRSTVDNAIALGIVHDLPAIVNAIMDAVLTAANVSESVAGSVAEVGEPSSGEWLEGQHSLHDVRAGIEPPAAVQHDTAADNEPSGTSNDEEDGAATTSSTIAADKCRLPETITIVVYGTRPCAARNSLWLHWREQNGMEGSPIRHKWNALSEECRREIAPNHYDTLRFDRNGTERVTSGITATIGDRTEALKNKDKAVERTIHLH